MTIELGPEDAAIVIRSDGSQEGHMPQQMPDDECGSATVTVGMLMWILADETVAAPLRKRWAEILEEPKS